MWCTPWLALLLLFSATAAGAQNPARQVGVPRSAAIIAALDVGTLPDAFTSRCGRSLHGAFGTGAYFGARVSRGWLVGQVDTRAVWENMDTGCDLGLHIVRVGDELYEERRTQFEGLPSVPFAMSTVRLGAEAWRGPVRLVALAGTGVVWSRRLVPVGVVAGGAALGSGARSLLIEVELAQVHLRTTQSRGRFRLTPAGVEDLGTTDASIRLRPTMFTVRAGVAWALRSLSS